MAHSLRGLVFDVQGFSVHDGPGCRTLFFMKGCPLKCSWCCNPEGQSFKPQLMYSQRKCKAETYSCVGACPVGAISKANNADSITLDWSKCEKCHQFSCVNSCYNGALRVVGRDVTVEEAMEIVTRDRAYWGQGGGVTFGGGEPLAQPEFTTAMLERLYNSYVHTAIETCAHVSPKILERALNYADWVFVDIKHMDPEKHREGTGVTNELILKNIEGIIAQRNDSRIVVRIPVVPGFNDSDENMKATATFMKKIRKKEVNLLPFHRLGTTKYEQLGWEYKYRSVTAPLDDKMMHVARIFEQNQIKCYVGSGTPF
ncbi:MAG: glycyl-radical enzyme activating protein [Candidatus Bathyarchaeia archaeon]|jgi:pyruvate formate lyase activating enzyme